MSAPLPSPELARRVGVVDQNDPVASFDEMGERTKESLFALQPAGWFTGRRILDFGCGSGKLLRHLQDEAEDNEIYGCDIHEPSIQWIKDHLSDRLTVFVSDETPPLPLPGEHLDLVWAMSVFTHLTDHWSDWLLEIHRVLAPGGRLVATFLGEGMSESIAGEPWNAERVGMNVLSQWQDWDLGGPSVLHSEWWLRAHWGRAFDVEQIIDGPEPRHGVVVLTKRDVPVTRAELLADSGDPRERLALEHNVRQVARQAGKLAADRAAIDHDRRAIIHERDRVAVERDDARRALASVRGTLETVLSSRSWRLTRPLRAVRSASRSDRRAT